MPRVADGVLPSTSSSNKVAPVEVDPPPTEIALLAARSGEEPAKSQDQLASVDDELGKLSNLKEIGSGASCESADVAAGDNKVDSSSQAGSDIVASQVVGVATDDVAPPSLKGSQRRDGSGESDIERGHSHLKGPELGSGPLRGGFSVASDSSVSSGSGYQDFSHELKVAVTPDGKIITGRCLTYEDGRGGPLASNFFVSELHYSSANPSYHKRNKGRWRACVDVGCTVT